MPDRIIRDELLTSERYWSVGIEAQQLFVHLLLRADSLGRFSGNNFSIRMACYPGHARNPDLIEKLLSMLHDADLIRIYTSAGERFIFIPRYRQRLRYLNSKYPVPPKEINDINVLPESKSDLSQTAVRPESAEVKRSEEVPLPKRRRSGPKEVDAGIEVRRETWTAYSNAYQDRYGVPPASNAEARSAIKRFCSKIQAADAPAVAAYYVSHAGAFYSAKGHDPKLLAMDAAKLRMEWATGTQITQTRAMQGDKTATRGNLAKELIDEYAKNPKR